MKTIPYNADILIFNRLNDYVMDNNLLKLYSQKRYFK